MQKNRFTFRSAFSMIELIMVIVILGIVSSIGAELIAKVYENYILQRALHRTSAKTELVATQIANRLAYAIPNTVIARLDNTNFTAIENVPDKNYSIMEWISYDADSFKYTNTPGWSGFCDVNDTTKTNTNQISTPGSTLEVANTIITNLTGSLTDASVLFPGMYNANTVGFEGSDPNATGVSKISAYDDTNHTITFVSLATGVTRVVKEHYKLAWTAYAVVPTELTSAQYISRGFDSTHKLYDLELHYNFQPWDGSYYSNSTKATLIRNVSVFNFLGTGDTIRFKLCVQENIGGTNPITVCKEKAVIR